jgi:hypothetical protein
VKKTLRQRIIRLAAGNPVIRPDLLPLLGTPRKKVMAANPMTLDKVAGRGPKLIERLVNDRMSVDWAPFPSDYKYKHYQEEKGEKFDAYREWALSELDEINEDIREVRGDILKRFIRFEKSALPALKELGLTVKLGKITFGDQGSTYVDYDAHQVVEEVPPYG